MVMNRKPGLSLRGDNGRRGLELPGGGRSTKGPMSSGNSEGGKQLVVGRDISLSGEIKECQNLVVEGRVEAAMNGGDLLEVIEGGIFVGPAKVNEAIIDGRFEGELTVLGRLLVKANGVVSGVVRYGQLEVECGGELKGEMAMLDEQAVHALPTSVSE